MKLTTIREIYKNREAYLDKEVTVGGWVRSVRDSKPLVSSFCTTEAISKPCRSYTTMRWKTSLRFPK